MKKNLMYRTLKTLGVLFIVVAFFASFTLSSCLIKKKDEPKPDDDDQNNARSTSQSFYLETINEYTV